MNPLSNGRIVSFNTDPRSYHSVNNGIKRGSREFVMSRSELMAFNRNPWSWFHGAVQGDTEATEFGDLLDSMVTTPDLTEIRFALEPATYPAPPEHAKVKSRKICVGAPLPWNNNAGFCEQWHEERSGITVIKSSVWNEVQAAYDSLMADSRLKELIGCSQKQVFVTSEFHDSDTGLTIKVKSLLDLVPSKDHPKFGKCIADLKSALDASTGAWPFVTDKRKYQVQAAMGVDAYMSARPGEDRGEFRHVIVEKEHPYPTGRRILTDDFMENGRAIYTRALKAYARCVVENFWPGYDDGDGTFDGWSFTSPTASMAV